MKQLLLALCLLLCDLPVRACDACGSNSANQQLGILPQQQAHFIGLQYRYASFQSHHPSLFEGRPDEHSQERYQSLQLWGRYQLSRRFQLFAFVPYQYNSQISDGLRTTANGIGDMSILTSAMLIRPDPIHVWRHALMAGAGVKLPTGAYRGITNNDRQGLPNLQPGTGSLDFVFNSYYTVQHARMGLNAEANYVVTTANRFDYKYGNKVSFSLQPFWRLGQGAIRCIPYVGIRVEQALHDYDNYRRKWLNDQSGGYMMYATAGCQWYYHKAGVQISAQIPVSQHYSGGYVQSRYKAEAGLLFIF